MFRNFTSRNIRTEASYVIGHSTVGSKAYPGQQQVKYQSSALLFLFYLFLFIFFFFFFFFFFGGGGRY